MTTLLLPACLFAVLVWLILKPDHSDKLVADVINLMLEAGYMFECGPHYKCMTGYFADFYKPEDRHYCEDCGCLTSRDWNTAGHGKTLKDAVVMAAKIATKQVVDIPRCSAFER